jgi:hypothetical protein
MANCIQYQNLSPKEKIEFIGKLVHLVQNDETAFSRAVGMILKGDVQGAFDDVKINPAMYEENKSVTLTD